MNEEHSNRFRKECCFGIKTATVVGMRGKDSQITRAPGEAKGNGGSSSQICNHQINTVDQCPYHVPHATVTFLEILVEHTYTY